jgi:hypothetical protein
VRRGHAHKQKTMQTHIDHYIPHDFALKVGIPDSDKFSVMPQRGNGLQPRVAASATLGKESDLIANRKRGCVCFVHFSLGKRHNRVAVEISFLTSSQGSRSGNPGLESVAPLGH